MTDYKKYTKEALIARIEQLEAVPETFDERVRDLIAEEIGKKLTIHAGMRYGYMGGSVTGVEITVKYDGRYVSDACVSI